ncbi:MAG TPA: hypothetical protein DDX99_13540 [Desulfofustis sp.]|nr:hypothetical protein [Desulfofustis sp.]HBH31050.1 hypothetical protein [Desulfofustis sp.]
MIEEPHISTFRKPLRVYFGPNDMLVNIDVNVVDNQDCGAIDSAVKRVKSRIRAAIPAATRICIEAKALIKRPNRRSHTTSWVMIRQGDEVSNGFHLIPNNGGIV